MPPLKLADKHFHQCQDPSHNIRLLVKTLDSTTKQITVYYLGIREPIKDLSVQTGIPTSTPPTHPPTPGTLLLVWLLIAGCHLCVGSIPKVAMLMACLNLTLAAERDVKHCRPLLGKGRSLRLGLSRFGFKHIGGFISILQYISASILVKIFLYLNYC